MHSGTADIPVAEEAAQTAEYFGSHVERIYDVGVSGIHRLFSQRDLIQSAIKAIAVAGMEGALASVLGGLVDKPVIAVPTSVGYGACMEGLSALLTMMTSCANGIAVVNIDNGYGAGYIANRSIIWQNRTEKRRHRMGKQLYFECASGISGDMAVAALIDLGAPEAQLQETLATLPITEAYEIRISRVKSRAWIPAILM